MFAYTSSQGDGAPSFRQGDVSPSGVTRPHRILGEPGLLLDTQAGPGCHRKQGHQPLHFMCSRKVDSVENKIGLQVLLHALLRVKTDVSVGHVWPSFRAWAAFLRSFSALATHSDATRARFSAPVIENSPIERRGPLDGSWDFLPPLEVLG